MKNPGNQCHWVERFFLTGCCRKMRKILNKSDKLTVTHYYGFYFQTREKRIQNQGTRMEKICQSFFLCGRMHIF